MQKMQLPKLISDILYKIHESGYEAYLVGGAVRDAILGRENKDYDLCTNMPLPLLKKLYPSLVVMKPNDHRNTGVIRLDGEEIEFTEFRGNSLFEDLSNRDFSMNAMAVDKDGNIIDYFNGIESISRKELSLIKKDGEAFRVDPLRIMRAVRIASKMDFDIDNNCKEQMIVHKNLLANVPVERIYKELIQILITKNPAKYIRDNKEVIFEVIPELKPLDGFNQQNNYHIYDVFEHTLKVLENTKQNIYLRFAALFHDIGKPNSFTIDEKGKGHFYGHPEVSKEIFESVATRLKFDNFTKNEVGKLIKFHDYDLGKKRKSIFNFFNKFGTRNIDLLFELKKADIKAQNPEYIYRLDDLNKIRDTYTSVLEADPCLSIKDLKINGKYLIEKGFAGKEIGNILNDLLYQVQYQKLPNNLEALNNYVDRKYFKKNNESSKIFEDIENIKYKCFEYYYQNLVNYLINLFGYNEELLNSLNGNLFFDNLNNEELSSLNYFMINNITIDNPEFFDFINDTYPKIINTKLLEFENLKK